MVTAMKEKNKLNVVRVKLVEDIPLYSDKIVESPKIFLRIKMVLHITSLQKIKIMHCYKIKVQKIIL